jgi:hypothetical protein
MFCIPSSIWNEHILPQLANLHIVRFSRASTLTHKITKEYAFFRRKHMLLSLNNLLSSFDDSTVFAYLRNMEIYFNTVRHTKSLRIKFCDACNTYHDKIVYNCRLCYHSHCWKNDDDLCRSCFEERVLCQVCNTHIKHVWDKSICLSCKKICHQSGCTEFRKDIRLCKDCADMAFSIYTAK